MNASTATIYRHALDRPMDEATGELGGNEPGAPDTWNFSIRVAKGWEEAFFSTPTPLTRKVAIRSAMTFSPDPGGIFDVLLGLVRHGLGGTSGSGRQFVSWIHEADFVRAIDLLIAREDFTGVVNLASPNPLPNRDFMRALRDAWGARFGLPASEWMLRSWRLADADRVGTGPQEPPRCAGPPSGCRLPVSVSGMASCRSRPGCSLARS